MTPVQVLPPIPRIELAPGISMSFEVIPPVAVQEAALAEGKPLSFLMGSRGYRPEEEPRHRVVIPRPFYLGTFPVTQEEFACFRPQHRNHFHGKPKHPVENVSWDDAREFLVWLGKKARDLPRGFVPRLPCEAEWEYACQAGADTEYYNGDGEGALRQVGWYGEGWETGGTHPFGEKIGNPWGLHDMHGNVWEWCEDVWDATAYAKRRGGWMARGWSDADAGADTERYDGIPHRVGRGGSWVIDPGWCRAAIRGRGRPGRRGTYHGFRVFLGLPGPAEPEKPSGGPEAVREREEGTTDLATGRPEDRRVKAGTKRVSESVKG